MAGVMERAEIRKNIIEQLKESILQLEGFKPQPDEGKTDFALGIIEHAFPYDKFPIAAIHEFLCDDEENIASTNGFLTSLLSKLMQGERSCIWISPFPQVFAPALKSFGICPERIIFIQLHRDKDILWAMEEALKCKGLAGVVAELQELSFAQSRRLQLAVENSRVTGFVLRKDSKKVNTTACVARWRISPLPSYLKKGLPGVGYPRWQVELLRVKNGEPGIFKVTVMPQGLIAKGLRDIQTYNKPQFTKTGT